MRQRQHPHSAQRPDRHGRQRDGIRRGCALQPRFHARRLPGRCHPRRQPLPLRRHGCDRAAQPRHRASQAGDRPLARQGTHDQHYGRRHALRQLRRLHPHDRLHVREPERRRDEYPRAVHGRRKGRGPRQTAAPLAQLGAVRRGFHRAGDDPRTGRQQQRGDLCPPDGEVSQAPQQGLHRSHLHRAAPRRGRAHACRGGRRRISRGAHQGLPHARQPGARTAAGLAQPHGHRG